MFTPRKRHLRKKRFFLSEQKTFALFNASNLKASKVTDIKLSLPNAKLYFVPLYLTPPKLGLGYPLIMIIYDQIEYLQKNITELLKKLDCIGVSIENRWYPINYFTKTNTTGLEKKLLALTLLKFERVKH